jgi:hypothetical protein
MRYVLAFLALTWATGVLACAAALAVLILHSAAYLVKVFM